MRVIASVVVQFKEESPELPDVIRTVFSQEYKDIEVILLASAPVPEAVLKEFPVRVIETDGPPGKRLNEAFEAAQGTYVAVIDSHAVPRHSRWLHNLLSHFIDEEVAAVSGHCWDPERITMPVSHYRQNLPNFIQNPEFSLDNTNCAYRRSTWEKHPFHESLLDCVDREWAFRILQEGYYITMEYLAGVHFQPPESGLGPAAFRRYWYRSKIIASFLNKEALHPWRFGKKVVRKAWETKDLGRLRTGVEALWLSRKLHYEIEDLGDLFDARLRFLKEQMKQISAFQF